MRIQLAPALASLALLFTSCAAVGDIPVANAETDWIADFTDTVHVPASVAAGFADQRTGGRLLATGDRVLFEVLFEREGEVERNYLAFEVLGPKMMDGERMHFKLTGEFTSPDEENGEVTETFSVSSPVHRVGVRLFDPQGELLRESEVGLGEFVGTGQMPGCAVLDGLDEQELQKAGMDAETRKVFMGSLRSLIALVSLAQDDDVLSDLMWDVIDKPSLFSLVASLGVNVNVSPRYDLSVKYTNTLFGAEVPGPYRVLPMAFTINDRPALDLNLLVANASPPWTLTSGVIAFRGQHPTKDVSVRARLVGASSGG